MNPLPQKLSDLRQCHAFQHHGARLGGQVEEDRALHHHVHGEQHDDRPAALMHHKHANVLLWQGKEARVVHCNNNRADHGGQLVAVAQQKDQQDEAAAMNIHHAMGLVDLQRDPDHEGNRYAAAH